VRAVRRAQVAAVWLAGLCIATPADAFTYVVQKSDTLAGIAERMYGRIPYERILVHANALEACGGSPIVPGMRLEIPAVAHHRVTAGETWQGLARDLLGDPTRAEKLAASNDAKSWIPPEDGADILVPYNLRYVVEDRETIPEVSAKFFADKESAWMLDRYNHVEGSALQRGDVVLVPLTDLPLTEEGKQAAREAEGTARSEVEGAAREAQRKAANEMPSLLAEQRGGRYLEAVVHGNRMLAMGDLTRAQLADIHRVLTEAYVALEATGLAAAACQKWRMADPTVVLDPVTTSPKIIDACKAGEQLK
jgi:hypothetical protein